MNMDNLGYIMAEGSSFEKAIKKIKDAARDERWDYVDSKIPAIVKDSRFVDWAAKKGISSKNGNVRDLGVSIIEKADISFGAFPSLKDSLYALMKKDSNTYVRYRSAFALSAHGAGEYQKDVVGVLKKAAKDKDVSDIAKEYLSRIV